MGKILIIDDDLDLLSIYRELFSVVCASPEIRTAVSGLEALALIGVEEFDVCLVDLRMPGMSGFELIGRILKVRPGVRLAVLSGVTDPAVERAVLEAGAHRFFRKPTTAKELGSLLEEVQGLLPQGGGTIRSASDGVMGAEPAQSRTGAGAARSAGALYPFLMGGLLHNAINTQVSLSGQIELIRRAGADAALDARARDRLQVQVSHLGAYLRLMQQVSQEFYSPGGMACPAEQIEELCRRSAQESPEVEMRYSIDPQLGEVALPAGLISFVVGELLRNSVRACSNRKDAQISIGALVDRQGEVVRIECADNGPGLPASVARGVLTQELRAPRLPGGGGYGLFLIQELVSRLRGQLLAENTERGGALIRVLIPYSID